MFMSRKDHWQWQNPVHRICGKLSFVLGGVSVVSGLYSGSWGTTRLGERMQLTLAALVASGYTLLLVKSAFAKPPKQLAKDF